MQKTGHYIKEHSPHNGSHVSNAEPLPFSSPIADQLTLEYLIECEYNWVYFYSWKLGTGIRKRSGIAYTI